jgi:hypothetical protein
MLCLTFTSYMQFAITFTYHFLLKKLDILCVCKMTADISLTWREVLSNSRVANIFITQSHAPRCGLVLGPPLEKITVGIMYVFQSVQSFQNCPVRYRIVSTVRSESRCALKLRYVDQVFVSMLVDITYVFYK